MGRVLCCGLLACSATTPIATTPPDRFDAQSLYADLLLWLDAPRTLGDPQRSEGIEALDAALRGHGATVVRDDFDALDSTTGETYSLTNLYASTRPDAAHHLLLATHFDVRPWAESDPDPAKRDAPIPGANDGTSGLVVLFAVLPELARTLPPDVGLSIVLFDGEELGHPGQDGYCAGSRHLAAHPQDAPPFVQQASMGIVLDMVGDADLQIFEEPHSIAQNPKLVEDVWHAAAVVGAPFVPRQGPTPILDDHVYLSRAGIPSILLIDYTYPAWHTHADDASRVSGRSLALVADVVFEAVMRRAEQLSAAASSRE